MQEGVKRTPKHRRDANNGVAPVLFVGGDADATRVCFVGGDGGAMLGGVASASR